MEHQLRTLDLFSGIGGFALGLQMAGLPPPVAFCECDEFCRRVLAHHWPDVPIHPDVRGLTADAVGAVDIVTGGFPCQETSLAGSRRGLDGAHSGLWREFARILGELRARYAIVENSAGLRSRGLGRVLGDLAALGYDAEWHCIPASAVGAPHSRDRVWILAYPQRGRRHRIHERGEAGHLAPDARDGRAHVPAGPAADDNGGRVWRRGEEGGLPVLRRIQAGGAWALEPELGRLAHGVPQRVARLRALGNAVVPPLVAEIGRAILEAERAWSIN